jgi:predicted N-formylglutamate amidohydrolase
MPPPPDPPRPPGRAPHRALVLSCEHGGRRVPAGFPEDAPPDDAVDRRPRVRRDLRRDPPPPTLRAALDTHRGWDPGALSLARQMALRLGVPLRYSTISRLVVEPNRSEWSPELFSPWSRGLPEAERRTLVRRYHRRHRRRVRRAVEEAAAAWPAPEVVIHVGVHSFTPVLDGEVRPLEVGILLDPGREAERWVAESWARELAARRPDLRIRLNAPYDGRTDGLVTTLRSDFREGIRPGCAYVGLELEVSQGLLGPDGRFPPELAMALAASLAASLDSTDPG